MKIMLTLALILGFTLHAQDTGPDDNINPPAPLNTTPGRFQLIAGTVTTDDTKPLPIILRIDTATGRVWKYECLSYPVPNSGGHTILTEGWVIITEDILKSIDTSKRTAAILATNTPAK